MRRVFYPHGPAVILVGLGWLLMAGWLARDATGVGLLGPAVVVLVSLAAIFYRNRVVLDCAQETLTAEQFLFLWRLGSRRYRFDQARSLEWVHEPPRKPWEFAWHDLMLHMEDGSAYVLVHTRRPDPALADELRRTLRLV